MSLSRSERESAFVAYCLAYAGVVPPANTQNMVIVAAYALGADGRATAERPWKVHEVAREVEALLSDSPPGAEPSSADPTADALAAYAEGVGDTLDALEKWRNGPPSDGLPSDLRAWIDLRRASAPKRWMTAAEVLGRVRRWNNGDGDPECADLHNLIAKLSREIKGANR